MYFPGLLAPNHRIVGPAYTVRMVPASDKTFPTPPTHFADAIPKDAVVFISQPKGLISSCWGELISACAQRLGAAGVVIDGRFRDIAEHCELGMGPFARGVSILGSNIFTRSSELNMPVWYENVEVGREVMVRPGDYIMGDADGVVVVPEDKVEKCVRLCQERYDIDEETRRCSEQAEPMGPTIQRLKK